MDIFGVHMLFYPMGDKQLMGKVMDISAEGFKAMPPPAPENLPRIEN